MELKRGRIRFLIMLDIEFVLKFLKKNKVEGEIFYQEKEKHSLTIYGGDVEKYQVSKEQGIGIRILKKTSKVFHTLLILRMWRKL